MGRGAANPLSQFDTGTADEFVTREQRISIYGIDCVDALEWRDWLPGGEYVRRMLVKNVSNKVRP